MPRDPRYDILFEPVRIGPVTTKNRFYQVPHCNGMGYRDPTAHAHMRGIKAEGGWAVVCTEEVEIHASSEVAPFIEGRLWDDRDIPMHARLCEQVTFARGLRYGESEANVLDVATSERRWIADCVLVTRSSWAIWSPIDRRLWRDDATVRTRAGTNVTTTANTSIWFLMLSRWNSRSRRAMVSCQTVTVGRPPGVQQDSLSVTPRKGEPAHR
jgi:hypothetical protein